MNALKIAPSGKSFEVLTIAPTFEAIREAFDGQHVVSAPAVALDGTALEVWCLDEMHISEDTPLNRAGNAFGLTIFGTVIITGEASAEHIADVSASVLSAVVGIVLSDVVAK